MSSSIQARTLGADWPPSVRVRTSSMDSPFVKALASARIGATFNQYADSPLRRRRLADYLGRRRRASIAPRRRGGGLPRGARLGDPVHLRAPADRHRPGRGQRDDRAPHARRARDRRGRAALERRADAPAPPGRPASNRRPTRAEIEAGLPFVERARRGPARGRRRTARGSARSAPRTSAIRPTAAQPSFVRRLPRCALNVTAQHDPARRRRSP